MDVNEIIANNKGLVYRQLHNFKLASDPEAESIGYEALYNAIITFRNDCGATLSTYATVCIYNALCTYLRQLHRVKQLEVISYNNFIDDEHNEFTDVLVGTCDVLSELCTEEERLMLRSLVSEQIHKLTNPKHVKIVVIWRDSDYTATTTSIADKVGVSQSYVSQVINNFKAKIKKGIMRYV